MDVHHVGEFAESGVLAHKDTDLLNDVGSMGTIGMTAKDNVIRRHKEFQQTFALVHGEGLAIGSPEGLLADVINTLFFQLILQRAYTGGLRRGEDGGWHDAEVDIVVLA